MSTDELITSDRFTDVWESSPLLTASTPPAPDLLRLRNTHSAAGYREGHASARAAAVQAGFDEGFLLGAALGLRAGYLQGVVEGLEQGVDREQLTIEERNTFQQTFKGLKDMLQLPYLLNEHWIRPDGIWKWPVESSNGTEPTVGIVANAHPVLLEVNREVARFAVLLGVRREAAYV